MVLETQMNSLMMILLVTKTYGENALGSGCQRFEDKEERFGYSQNGNEY